MWWSLFVLVFLRSVDAEGMSSFCFYFYVRLFLLYTEPNIWNCNDMSGSFFWDVFHSVIIVTDSLRSSTRVLYTADYIISIDDNRMCVCFM